MALGILCTETNFTTYARNQAIRLRACYACIILSHTNIIFVTQEIHCLGFFGENLTFFFFYLHVPFIKLMMAQFHLSDSIQP